MSDKEKSEIQKQILALEQSIQELKEHAHNINEVAETMQKRLQYLKDIVWDKQSKRESSSMYKVLNDEKEFTQVQSSIGRVKVDKTFMKKEIKKHLNNPQLRGMVTTQEVLSFPKVAKNIEPHFNPQQQGYDWRVRANDESQLVYGERDFGNGHKLLTSHSKTERGERGQLHQEFNDRNFHNSVSNATIPNPTLKNTETNHSKTERGGRGYSHRQFDNPDFHNSVSNTTIPNSTLNNTETNFTIKRNNEGSLVGIVNSDTLTQKGEMDELVNKSLLANPTKEIISQNSDKSQAQETTNLKQITRDTAVLAPQSSALLIKTYEQLGEERLAHTLISTIETDKVTMQEVSKHYLALDNNTDELKAQLSELGKQQTHTQTLSEGAERVGETAEKSDDKTNKPPTHRQ